jgi:glucose/arabinose dehydrogenase
MRAFVIFLPMKRRAALALTLLAAFLLAVTAACGSSSTSTSDSSAPKFAFGLSAQVVASGADAASVRAMEFAPDGRMFYAEQFSGDIRIVLADGTLQPTPFATLQAANSLDLDWGLTGLALDPQFATNHFVYAFYTAPVGDNIGKPTIVRFTDTNGTGQDQLVISSDFPQTFPNHQGYNANGEIHFGPDGFLYASVGDYDQGSADPAQGGHPEVVGDLSSPIGKLLRLNKADGSAAPGNPFAAQAGADPRVFAYGFREPFSFTFDPVSASIYGTDNTPDTCEELNVIAAGQSYGWPTGWTFPFADCTSGQGAQPIYNFAREGQSPGDFLSFVETQGISFLKNSTYSQLTDGLIVCESQKSVLKDASGKDVVSPGALLRFVFSAPTTVASSDIIVPDCKGDAYAHNGVVYYSDATQLLKLTESTGPGNNQQAPPPAGG